MAYDIMFWWLTCAWSHRIFPTRPSTWWERGDWHEGSGWCSLHTFPSPPPLPDLRQPGTSVLWGDWARLPLPLLALTNDWLVGETGTTWSWLCWEGGGRWSMTLILPGSFSRHTISGLMSPNINVTLFYHLGHTTVSPGYHNSVDLTPMTRSYCWNQTETQRHSPF